MTTAEQMKERYALITGGVGELMRRVLDTGIEIEMLVNSASTGTYTPVT